MRARQVFVFFIFITLLCIQFHADGSVSFWRSSLYPQDWRPAFQDSQGRFLHDFSYAGYHNGEDPLPENPPGAHVDAVSDFGADSTGASDATAAVQAAIDAVAVAGGGVVYLPAGLYRFDGVLRVTHAGTVIRGVSPALTRLYFTKFAGMAYTAHIAFTGNVQQGPHVALAVDGEDRAVSVYVADAAGLAVGDDVSVGWVITPEFTEAHGMTGTWTAFTNQWKPIFRRKIVAIDTAASPVRITLDIPLRYAARLRDAASIRKETGHLTECGLESLAIANAVNYEDAWTQMQVQAVEFTGAVDCWVRNVHSFISPADPENRFHFQNCGLRIIGSKRFTVADCVFERAQNRGGGGCGYLFQVGTSNEVLFRDCVGRDGRHNFIQNWDFGTAGCVWLRCASSGGKVMQNIDDPIGSLGSSEYHHSLAMACLVDQCTVNDGWYGGNRGLESSGAGHTVTENAYWNIVGAGFLRSWAYGWGYVIGTRDIRIMTDLGGIMGPENTAPQDFVEGAEAAPALLPQSLYEDQLARRLGHPDTDGDGILDADEIVGSHATDPANPDTDADGLSDGAETRGQFGPATNPLDTDTDADGFDDYRELIVLHTDPTDKNYPTVPAASHAALLALVLMLLTQTSRKLSQRSRFAAVNPPADASILTFIANFPKKRRMTNETR